MYACIYMLIKKETPIQLFPLKYYKIFKKNLFYGTLLVVVSDHSYQ